MFKFLDTSPLLQSYLYDSNDEANNNETTKSSSGVFSRSHFPLIITGSILLTLSIMLVSLSTNINIPGLTNPSSKAFSATVYTSGFLELRNFDTLTKCQVSTDVKSTQWYQLGICDTTGTIPTMLVATVDDQTNTIQLNKQLYAYGDLSCKLIVNSVQLLTTSSKCSQINGITPSYSISLISIGITYPGAGQSTR